jgi:hypothetical protein
VGSTALRASAIRTVSEASGKIGLLRALRQTSMKVGAMIRKLKSGQYRLYSRKINPKTGKRRNLGTFPTRAKAEQHERAVQYFKRRA